MKKVCIFCGKKPINKTKEHVISKWLIELTGDINRKARFGPFIEKGKLTHKTFPFDSFTFPSCKKCNEEYSPLESRAKRVIKDILSDNYLDSKDLSLLLTWFDKLRIGLWLSSIYMIMNFFGIEPNFYINSGAFTRDRMLLIYKNKRKIKHLQTIGTNVPAFQFIPCCFSIVIDNYAFINIANNFLLSKNLGLPYPKDEFLAPNEQTFIILENGVKNVSYPLLEKEYDVDCTEIYQPILLEWTLNSYYNLYNSKYIKSFFVNFLRGIGKVFYNFNNQIREYPVKKSKVWIPKITKDLKVGDFINLIGIQTYKFQNYFIKKIKVSDPQMRKNFRRKQEFSLLINKNNIERLKSILY